MYVYSHGHKYLGLAGAKQTKCQRRATTSTFVTIVIVAMLSSLCCENVDRCADAKISSNDTLRKYIRVNDAVAMA